MAKATLITVCGCRRVAECNETPQSHMDIVFRAAHISPFFTSCNDDFTYAAGRQAYQTRRFLFQDEHNEDDGYVYREILDPPSTCRNCKDLERRYNALWDSVYKVEEHL